VAAEERRRIAVAADDGLAGELEAELVGLLG
jgi:hypothetical protein